MLHRRGEITMADDSLKLSITYSSHLIPPSEFMSILVVFYDEIWLPSSIVFDIKMESYPKEREFVENMQKGLGLARKRWLPLFEEGILQTLPSVSMEFRRGEITLSKMEEVSRGLNDF